MKRYISAILIPCFLLQLFGCYSMEPLTNDYQNGDDISNFVLTSKSGENYAFDKFNSVQQLANEPTKQFFSDYSFQDSNFVVVVNRFNAKGTWNEKNLILTDSLVYNVNNLSSINYEKYDGSKTFLVVGSLLLFGLIVAAVIYSYNWNWDIPEGTDLW
jgi:hypothetical protein